MGSIKIPHVTDLLLQLYGDFQHEQDKKNLAANLNGDGQLPAALAEIFADLERDLHTDQPTPWYSLPNVLRDNGSTNSIAYDKFYQGLETLDTETILAIARDYQNIGQLSSVAYTARREFVIHQLEQRMWKVLDDRRRQGVSMDEPLAWGDYVPGGPAEMYFNHYDENGELHQASISSPDQAIKFARHYTHQIVDTPHPTYQDTRKTDKIVSDLTTATVQREWVLTAKEFGHKLSATDYALAERMYRESLSALLHEEERLPGKGKFIVIDESEHIISNTVNHQMNGRADYIRQSVNLLRYRFGEDITDQQLVDFVDAVNIQFINWGGLDGDGSVRIFREHHLYALVHQAVNMAIGYPVSTQELSTQSAESPVRDLNKTLTKMIRPLLQLRGWMRGKQAENGDILLSNEEFEEASYKFNQICITATGGETWPQFTRSYAQRVGEAFLSNPNSSSSVEYLVLRKNLMISGMHGCSDQPRRNSVWFDEALQAVLRKMDGMEDIDFVKMSEEDRKPLLNNLFRPENHAALQAASREVLVAAAPFVKSDRDYQGPNREVLKGAHTLGSFWLAIVQNPESHDQCVSAEIERRSTYAVMLLLQICARGLGRAPGDAATPVHWLMPIGLFEDPTNLPKWTSVQKGAMDDYPFYRDLIVDVFDGKIIVMMGHSDLARHSDRGNASGPLFVALLDKEKGFARLEGMQIVSSSGRRVNLDYRVFHGFSVSDSWRSGLLDMSRFIIDPISAKGWMQFAQGIDRRNYYNTPASAKRAMETQMVRASKIWAGQCRLETDPDFDRAVSEALTYAAYVYQGRHYDGLMPKSLVDLTAINGNFNKSSRSTMRDDNAKVACLWKREIDKVYLEKARAISVSTAMFVGTNDAGGYKCAEIVRSHLASLIKDSTTPIQMKLINRIKEISGNKSEPALFDQDGFLTPAAEQALYSLSHVYRHRINDMRVGVRRTDPDLRSSRVLRARHEGFKRPLPTETELNEYCAAAEVVCDALGISRPSTRLDDNVAETSETYADHFDDNVVETSETYADHFRETAMPISDIGAMEPVMIFGFALYDYMRGLLVKADEGGAYNTVGRIDQGMEGVLSAMNHVGISPPSGLSDNGLLRFTEPSSQRPIFDLARCSPESAMPAVRA